MKKMNKKGVSGTVLGIIIGAIVLSGSFVVLEVTDVIDVIPGDIVIPGKSNCNEPTTLESFDEIMQSSTFSGKVYREGGCSAMQCTWRYGEKEIIPSLGIYADNYVVSLSMETSKGECKEGFDWYSSQPIGEKSGSPINKFTLSGVNIIELRRSVDLKTSDFIFCGGKNAQYSIKIWTSRDMLNSYFNKFCS